MEEWRKIDLEKRERILLERRLKLKEKKRNIKLRQIEEDYQRSRELTQEAIKNRPNIKYKKTNKPLQQNKRYKILRKVYYGKTYISDDILYVNDYMQDYILNPLFTIESSMYEYYLHSIYDTKKGEYINAINL